MTSAVDNSGNRVLKGKIEIASYLGIHVNTLDRWIVEFKGRREVDLVVPVMTYPGPRMAMFRYVTTTNLIDRWVWSWIQIEHRERRARHTRQRARAATRGAAGAQPAPSLPADEPSTK